MQIVKLRNKFKNLYYKYLMSYSKKRIDYNNNWPDEIIKFSAQQDFEKLLNDKGIKNIFRPIKLPLIEEYHFQRLLSFKIDIYEQLPYRPDLAFDLAWRTFEAYCSFLSRNNNWEISKTWKILNKISEDILNNHYNQNENLASAFINLTKSIPLQATEFLIKRLFENTSSSIRSQQVQIIERTKDCLGNDLYNAIKTKYGDLTPENQRKAGMLLQIILSGQRVEINNKNYQLSKLEIAKLLINGIMYTYRNERFHGDSFSPFKSSKTQIKTFAHSYYSLITVYFFLSQLIYKHFPTLINLDDIAESLNENTIRYNLIFDGHKKK